MSVQRREETISSVKLKDLQRKAAEIRQRVKTDVEVITPEIAKEWLKKNIKNRRPKPGRIKTMVRDIKAGRWSHENWDCISFNGNGTLLNGQNRLMAIVEAKEPTIAHVMHGMNVTSIMHIDTGGPRSFADYLHIMGYPNAKLLAAICLYACMWSLQSIFAKASGAISNGEQEEVLLKYGDLQDAANYIAAQKGAREIGHQSRLGFLRWYTARRKKVESDIFFGGLLSGVGLEAGSPILILRNRLLAARRDPYGRIKRGVAMALMIKAWNAFVEGKKITRLTFHEGEQWPEKIA